MTRLLIIAPWWREPRVQNWSGQRDWLLYALVEDRGSGHFNWLGHAWTYRGAMRMRELERAYRERGAS